jgi:hypothetical protein
MKSSKLDLSNITGKKINFNKVNNNNIFGSFVKIRQEIKKYLIII